MNIRQYIQKFKEAGTIENDPGGFIWQKKNPNIDTSKLNPSLAKFITGLPKELQSEVLVTDTYHSKEHKEGSRHYGNNAIDLRFSDNIYNWSLTPEGKSWRKENNITLLNPNHGTAKHLHFSYGTGSENLNDVSGIYKTDSNSIPFQRNTQFENKNQFDTSIQTPATPVMPVMPGIAGMDLTKSTNEEIIPEKTQLQLKIEQQQRERDQLLTLIPQASLDKSYQKGGAVKDNIPNLQNKRLLEKRLTPLDFTKSYIQSQPYLDKLANQGYHQPREVVKYRLNNLNNTDIIDLENQNLLEKLKNKIIGIDDNEEGSHYESKNDAVIIDSVNDRKNVKNINKNTILAHEIGHAEIKPIFLNDNDFNELFNRQKTYEVIEKGEPEDIFTKKERDIIRKNIQKNGYSETFGHDLKPEENKADLNALRYYLYDKGIYDARKNEPFTKEHLNQIKEKSFIKDRLLKNYKEEDLIWLMNNIAQQDDNNEDSIYAKNGGITEKKTWIQNKIAFLIKENKPKDQAIAIAYSMWKQNNKNNM